MTNEQRIELVKAHKHSIESKRPKGLCLFCGANKSNISIGVQINNFCGDDEVFNAHKECYASYIKNDDGMKKEYDFSNAEKGKFYFGDDR